MKKVNYEKKTRLSNKKCVIETLLSQVQCIFYKNNKDGLEDRCDLEPPCSGNLITIFDGETIYALIIVIIE